MRLAKLGKKSILKREISPRIGNLWAIDSVSKKLE